MWHGFSRKFHVISCHRSTAFWSKLTPNSMNITHHLSRFYLFSLLEHDMDFGKVQVMEFPWHFPRQWWGFHRNWCHFRANCRQADMRTFLSPFFTGRIKIWHNKLSLRQVWGIQFEFTHSDAQNLKKTSKESRLMFNGLSFKCRQPTWFPKNSG